MSLRTIAWVMGAAVWAASSQFALAQNWSVDAAASSLEITIQGFADELVCGVDLGTGIADCFGLDPNGVPTLGPYALCPSPVPLPFAPPPCHGGWDRVNDFRTNVVTVQCPNFAVLGQLGRRDEFAIIDGSRFPCFGFPAHPSFAESSPYSAIAVRGIGGRTLEVRWISEVNNEVNAAEPYHSDGCAVLDAFIDAHLTNVSPGAPLRLIYSWSIFGAADTEHESFLEDPERAEIELGFDVPSMIPPVGVLVTDAADGDAGILYVLRSGEDVITVAPGGAATIAVPVTVAARAHCTSKAPGVPQLGLQEDDSSATFCGLLTITAFQQIREPEMVLVPGGDAGTGIGAAAGPAYSFRIGQYEISNREFAEFLNDAELDGGATERSSFMSFDPATGRVTIPVGDAIFEPQSVNAASRIKWNSTFPLGSRYTVEVGFENHPVGVVTWVGAVKYCNWLTIATGRPASHRCYIEGSAGPEWRPATIALNDWLVRELNAAERAALIGFQGYRLPMDDLGMASGAIGNQGSAYNEWFKAAAFDPAAPAVSRVGPAGETIPPFHWTYGFGRDTIDPRDANYLSSTDPYDDERSPVGYFNGADVLAGGGATRDTGNPWRAYDLSGNVSEWAQDRTSILRRAIHTGSYPEIAPATATTIRGIVSYRSLLPNIGFRICTSRIPPAPCIGDINGDGFVNLTDLARLLASFGLSAGDPGFNAAADLNGDGRVDLTDLSMLLARFGTACP